MGESTIEWTDATWNPTRGCVKVSPGCKNCYAETFAERWRGVEGHPYEQGFDPRLVPTKLLEPLSWRAPRRVFVNSMSDLFGEFVPDDYVDEVFATMLACEVLTNRAKHTFQILTKRADRMARYFAAPPATLLDRWGRAADGVIIMDNADVYFSEYIYSRCVARWDDRGCATEKSAPWQRPENLFPLRNVHLGVSVEDRRYGLPRIDALRDVPAALRFLSIEPLLEDLGEIDLRGIGWVIVGSESGRRPRPMEEGWVRAIRDQCAAAGVPFFYKQKLDEKRRKVSLPVLDGVQHAAFPEVRS